jgi:hypothetical protein
MRTHSGVGVVDDPGHRLGVLGAVVEFALIATSALPISSGVVDFAEYGERSRGAPTSGVQQEHSPARGTDTTAHS